jgi:hypothetical protein
MVGRAAPPVGRSGVHLEVGAPSTAPLVGSTGRHFFMPGFYLARLAYRIVLSLALGLGGGMAWARQDPET